MRFPSLYQVSASDWLFRLSVARGKAVTLAEISQEELAALQRWGFEWLYLLGVWETGPIGAAISKQNPAWQGGYRAALSDLADADVTGSPFAVRSYRVAAGFGGDESLAVLRERLRVLGIKLMLDFVPNHTAIDNPWTTSHPDRYVIGTENDLQREPMNFVRVPNGGPILAHGRDPYFPGWVDTAQLDYANPETREAMTEELRRMALRCDGVRCDMAMLLLPEVFQRTWNRRMEPFWPHAISVARQANPAFELMAEVYWGMEWELQQQGFDFTYDKSLYDRLLAREVEPVKRHLSAGTEYQSKLVRFLENHDEPRIAWELPFDAHRAAALITYGVPGLRFFHDGQLQGMKRKPSIHLRRREREEPDLEISRFYQALLDYLAAGAGQGDWRLLNPQRAWESNWTAEAFLCFVWSRDGNLRELVAVNFSDHQSQCLVPLPFDTLRGRSVLFRDRVSAAFYERDGSEVASRGLYLDLAAWGGHFFQIE